MVGRDDSRREKNQKNRQQKEQKEKTDISCFLELGLLRLSQKKNEYYDFFYDRFVIPILNHSGECVALGGRILDDFQKAPKYINSAESVLFSKS